MELEKPTRANLLKLLEIALTERRKLETAKIEADNQAYHTQYGDALKLALQEYGLDVSTKLFNNKWRRYVGGPITAIPTQVPGDSTIGVRITELIGEAPLVRKSVYTKRDGFQYDLPEVDAEYRRIQTTILTEDMSVDYAKGIIHNFAVGAETK